MNTFPPIQNSSVQGSMPSLQNTTSPAEVRTDSIVIQLQGNVSLDRISDWDAIASRIAPSNSGDEFAFVRDGRTIKRKSRGEWKGAFWHAKIKFSYLNPRGNIFIELRLNVTKYEAFLALHRHSSDDYPNLQPPYQHKNSVLSRLTLDGNSNFVPTHVRHLTADDRPVLFTDALTTFRRDLSNSLRHGGIGITDLDTPRSLTIRSRPGYESRLILRWTTWRVHRIESYVDYTVPNAMDTVRSAYLSERAQHDRALSRQHSVRHVLTHPILTDVERERGSISYVTRSNTSNRLCIYSKNPTTIRIEHRYISNTEDRPSIPVSDYQRDGMKGLIQWVTLMRRGACASIEAKRRYIAETVTSSPINGERLFIQLNLEAARFFDDMEQQMMWISNLVELGSPDATLDIRGYRPFLSRLISEGLFRRGSRGLRTHAHPDLQRYFLGLRRVREDWQN